MKNINFKELIKSQWIHLLALGLFIIATMMYFQPQFSGYALKQHDIKQYKGMSSEIEHFRDTHGEEPLWTNSMFGGMPTYQISLKTEGNLTQKVYRAMQLWMTSPAGMFFVYLLGFYIMLLCFRVDPWVAILGAFAFAFSSYYIIILEAGHNTKAATIGLMPPVIGAFYMAYQRNLKWGILLSALFMTMQLAANHPQVTYYLGILLAFIGLGELVTLMREKKMKRFMFATSGLIIAYLFAFGINYSKLSLTESYSKYTIRGGNDITLNADGTHNHDNTTAGGLDKDYITQWSYGIGESMTLVSPNVYGAASSTVAGSQFKDLLRKPDMRSQANLIANNNVYWGDQPFTSGPVYLGIIVFFLALLGLIYLKGPMKWFLLGATLLTLMLSWGKNFMGLTNFFLDYAPFYNKFRAVTIILAIVELTIPLLAALFLNELIKNREEIKMKIMPFYAVSAGLVGVFVLLTYTGLGNGYLSQAENEFVYSYEDQVKSQLAKENPDELMKHGIDINNPVHVKSVVDQQMKQVDKQFDALITLRKSIYQSSMWRSVVFLLLAIALITFFLKTSINKYYLVVGLLTFVVIDLVMVDLNYLNKKKSNGRDFDYWILQADKDYPYTITDADKQILDTELAANPDLRPIIDGVKVDKKGERGRVNQNELWVKKMQTLGANTNYRVYDPQKGFNDASVSYFHKSLNGYHGAKLRRIQNVKDFYIDYGDMNVFNMLNVKYFIQNGKATQNAGALGPVWFVKEVHLIPAGENHNEEILSLGNRYKLENKTSGKLIVNGAEVNEKIVSGREKSILFESDSIPLDLSTVTRSGTNASYVKDINGSYNWIPNAVLDEDTLGSFTVLVSMELVHSFNPKKEVIINEEKASNISSVSYSGEGSIEMTSYAPNAMNYHANTSETQFAVFSEMYYPDGWNAYIDGKPTEILRVNYLLRGIEIPSGDHEIEMRFEVPKYKTGNQLALAGSLLLFLLIGGAIVQDLMFSNKTKNHES